MVFCSAIYFFFFFEDQNKQGNDGGGTLPESGPCRAIRSEKGFGLLRPLCVAIAAIAIATIANRTNRTTANREYELAVILR